MWFFQDRQSPGSAGLVLFHDYGVEIQILVLFVVIVMVMCIWSFPGYWKFGLERHRIEFLWTLIPFLLVVLYAVPSILSLFLLLAPAGGAPDHDCLIKKEPEVEVELTEVEMLRERLDVCYGALANLILIHYFGLPAPVVVEEPVAVTGYEVFTVGHQWYWDYFRRLFLIVGEESDIVGEESDIVCEEDCGLCDPLPFSLSVTSSYAGSLDSFHLLGVDKCLFIQNSSLAELVIRASDVLHSFAIPSLGLKIDAVPGKDNVILMDSVKSGFYSGQCSEICGVNHRLIPIGMVVD
jgi:heme/copper-type cytochrome/quinol oxidase subunit 2